MHYNTGCFHTTPTRHFSYTSWDNTTGKITHHWIIYLSEKCEHWFCFGKLTQLLSNVSLCRLKKPPPSWNSNNNIVSRFARMTGRCHTPPRSPIPPLPTPNYHHCLSSFMSILLCANTFSKQLVNSVHRNFVTNLFRVCSIFSSDTHANVTFDKMRQREAHWFLKQWCWCLLCLLERQRSRRSRKKRIAEKKNLFTCRFVCSNIQSTPDKANLLGKSKKVRVYLEFELSRGRSK